MEKVDCYLDDQLLLSYTEPNKFISVAGVDADNGDLIVKAVNVSGDDYITDIKVDGAMQLLPSGKAYTISSTSLDVENTFAEPRKYIPVQSAVADIKNKTFQYAFPKYSVTVLRIKTK